MRAAGNGAARIVVRGGPLGAEERPIYPKGLPPPLNSLVPFRYRLVNGGGRVVERCIVYPQLVAEWALSEYPSGDFEAHLRNHIGGHVVVQQNPFRMVSENPDHLGTVYSREGRRATLHLVDVCLPDTKGGFSRDKNVIGIRYDGGWEENGGPVVDLSRLPEDLAAAARGILDKMYGLKSMGTGERTGAEAAAGLVA